MTEEARKTAKAMHQNECEDCVFNPTKLGCRWRKKGMYCDTDLHSAADLIESLSAQLEQVTRERDEVLGVVKRLSDQTELMAVVIEKMKRKQDAAEMDIKEAAKTGCLCYVCEYNNQGHCSAFDHGIFECTIMCGQYKWRGVEVE